MQTRCLGHGSSHGVAGNEMTVLGGHSWRSRTNRPELTTFKSWSLSYTLQMLALQIKNQRRPIENWCNGWHKSERKNWNYVWNWKAINSLTKETPTCWGRNRKSHIRVPIAAPSGHNDLLWTPNETVSYFFSYEFEWDVAMHPVFNSFRSNLQIFSFLLIFFLHSNK